MAVATNEQSGVGTPEPTRSFTRSRIIALALILVLAIGLAYVRFGPSPAPLSVPTGARAGDLSLSTATYATENGTYAADTGTLVVPENRTNPQSRLIALPVVRIRAPSDHPHEPVFWLQGGPGHSNMHFAQASRFADEHDIVLVGYRGVDGSSVLNCPEVESAIAQSDDLLDEQSHRAYIDAFQSCAKRLTDAGVDLDGYSVADQVDDLEAARAALGYPQIDLLSESAGTRTALIYAWRYPDSINRAVLVGVNPPGHFFWDPNITDQQIGLYSALCAQDESCRARTDDLAASMRRTAAHMPDRWLFIPIKQGNVRIASFFGLFESTPAAAPVTAPTTLDAWLAAADGDASGFWFASLAGDVLFPNMFVWGEYAAMGAQDFPRVQAYYAAGGDPGSILGNPGTDYVWGGGRLGAAWPASPHDAEYSQVRPSNVEMLLVSGQLDFSTPPQLATDELLPYMPNAHQVILAGFGHTAGFFSDQTEAGTRLVNTFFRSGQVDSSLYTRAPINFNPEVTDTGLGKRIAGGLVGSAAVAILSLLWMARRVHQRGSFGRTSSMLLRSIYPVVLGIGGWSLGALLVLTALSSVPINDPPVVIFSVGITIGLGIYWAWVHRAWPAETRRLGLLAAVGGAIVGAWLGFNVTAGFLALGTAILGAALGANLSLILFDVARARFAEASPPSTQRIGDRMEAALS